MKKKWIFLAPAAIVGMVLFIFIGGELVLHLWNWLLPALFGWHQITLWQAIGILHCAAFFLGALAAAGWGATTFAAALPLAGNA